MFSGVEDADRADDAAAGLDQVVAAAARQLAHEGHQALRGLVDEFVDVGLVDRLVASNDGMHSHASNSLLGRHNSVESFRCSQARGDAEGSLWGSTASAGGSDRTKQRTTNELISECGGRKYGKLRGALSEPRLFSLSGRCLPIRRAERRLAMATAAMKGHASANRSDAGAAS